MVMFVTRGFYFTTALEEEIWNFGPHAGARFIFPQKPKVFLKQSFHNFAQDEADFSANGIFFAINQLGPDPINKIQRKILPCAGIQPIISLTRPLVSTLIGQIPA